MSTMENFRQYASDFERTFLDDDWSRLRKYFTEDAVYEVRSTTFGCRLIGPDAIFRGIKKSLDGFDRRFGAREIAIVSVHEPTNDAFEVVWVVTYTKEGAPPFRLRGTTRARYEGDLITHLLDSYDEAMDREGAEWMAKYGAGIDVSYV